MHDPELHEDLRDLDSGPYPQWFTEALAVPRRERSTIVDGCDIHFFEWGAPDEGKPRRPGVVMTHGMMAHARCWAFIAPRLAQHYYVVAFDLSGMGHSGHPSRGYTLEQRAAEAAGLRKPVACTRTMRVPHLSATATEEPSGWRLPSCTRTGSRR